MNILGRLFMRSMRSRGFPRDLKFLVERMTPQEHAMALVRAIEYRLGRPAEESSA
jgi:hypothetical protein